MSLIDLGGPEGGRYWRVTTGQPADHPDAHAAAVHARVTGSVGCTYNDVTVERAEKPKQTSILRVLVSSDHTGCVEFNEEVEVEWEPGEHVSRAVRRAILNVADQIRGGVL